MQAFLRRRPQYTMLPTPLPDDASSALNDFYFIDSPTQDLLAVIDACLHNCYDVHRAKSIFERLRNTKGDSRILESRLYNSFLEAYLDMATNKEPENRVDWLEEAWILYNCMESQAEKVPPNASTYAIMLTAWLR